MNDNRQITFDIHELNLIYEDQRGMLESLHEGLEVCPDLQNCPREHFGEDFEDGQIEIRQEIMHKILDDANDE